MSRFSFAKNISHIRQIDNGLLLFSQKDKEKHMTMRNVFKRLLVTARHTV